MFEVPEAEVDETGAVIVKRVMEGAAHLDVPLTGVVDVGTGGASWADARASARSVDASSTAVGSGVPSRSWRAPCKGAVDWARSCGILPATRGPAFAG